MVVFPRIDTGQSVELDCGTERSTWPTSTPISTTDYLQVIQCTFTRLSTLFRTVVTASLFAGLPIFVEYLYYLRRCKSAGPCSVCVHCVNSGVSTPNPLNSTLNPLSPPLFLYFTDLLLIINALVTCIDVSFPHLKPTLSLIQLKNVLSNHSNNTPTSSTT